MALSVGTNSFASVADADAYFADRLNATAWTGATSAVKSAALVTAWRDLTTSRDPVYSFPTTIADEMIAGQCEQALFLINRDADAEARASMRAMGVRSASLTGAMAEVYDSARAGVVIAPRAAAILWGYASTGAAAVATIVREEPDEEDDV